MRYIAKGKCKKSEKAISWNQMGPQGLPGAKGDMGASGTNGATGVKGADGGGWSVVDSTGKILGDFISHIPSQFPLGGGLSAAFVFSSNGLIFNARSDVQQYYSTGGALGSYFSSNTLSRQPFASVGLTIDSQNTVSGYEITVDGQKVFKLVGEPQLFTGAKVYDSSGRLLTSEQALLLDSSYRWMRVEEISAPTYTAPLKLVAK